MIASHQKKRDNNKERERRGVHVVESRKRE